MSTVCSILRRKDMKGKWGLIGIWKRSGGKMKELPDWAVEGVSMRNMYYIPICKCTKETYYMCNKYT
jgi:hypothetical protein